MYGKRKLLSRSKKLQSFTFTEQFVTLLCSKILNNICRKLKSLARSICFAQIHEFATFLLTKFSVDRSGPKKLPV